jgi:rare lipoprotein A
VKVCRGGIQVLGLIGVLFFLEGCTSALRHPPMTAPTAPAKKRPPKAYPSGPGMRPYQINGQWYYPLATAEGYRRQGIASWYGPAFHGRPTACGERYEMNGISAAHKTLPLGTWVRVKNLENGRILDLRINDRGPFIPGRIIDLSLGAARKLGVEEPGTARVEVVALAALPPGAAVAQASSPRPANLIRGHFTVQVGAFGERENAERLARRLEQVHRKPQIKPTRSHHQDRILYRVLVGKWATLAAAEKKVALLKSYGFRDAFTIAEQ